MTVIFTTFVGMLCIVGKLAEAFLKKMGFGFFVGAISGLQQNLSGRYAIRSLNRLCHIDANNPEAVKKAKKHDVWVFYGHSNPYTIGFGYYKDEEQENYIHRGGITNNYENHSTEYYNIHNWMTINFVRLAFLHGCATASGKPKHWRGSPVPENQSIGASFNQKGAQVVVGWKDSQYSGPIFGVFNKHFWKPLYNGKSVAEAVKIAKEIATGLWARFIGRPEEIEAVKKVKIFGDGGLKLRP